MKVNLALLGLLTSLIVLGLSIGFLIAGIFISPWYLIGVLIVTPLLGLDIQSRLVQHEHAILRNFGVFGAMRYLMESIGPELRQYWIASDTEERPFDRRVRTEVYRYAKDVAIKTAAFGTLTNLKSGTIRHSMFPSDHSELQPYLLTFGEERGCEETYTITRPFIISAMSYGSLGSKAVRSLARGAKKARIPMNTGEGGYPKYHLMEKCDLIFQLGTAKFGARNADGTLNEFDLKKIADLKYVKMIELKFSQGAKPGKGGLLPAAKVTEEISELRGVPMGEDVRSPVRHVECETPEETVKFIGRVQEITGIPVGIKLCIGHTDEFEEFVREMKRLDIFPDWITIDGAEGGTGAAPQAFMDFVGMPLFPALEFVQETLVKEGVRDRTKLLAAGKLIIPGQQIKALAVGADAIYTARGFMFAIGCIQALQCNMDTCPVGITTHDNKLQRGLVVQDKANRVEAYVRNMEKVLFELLAATGYKSLQDLDEEALFRDQSMLDRH